MQLTQHDYRTASAALALVAAALWMSGCEETAEIRVQTVPKRVIEPQEFSGLSEQQHMILAAMVPHGGDAWVFRLDGSREDVAAQAEAFESFIASLSFVDGAARPQWELPSGWEEQAAPAGSLREATIQVPAEDGNRLDLSVSRLPMREDWLHYRLRNFNRWRMQLQLPIAGADELAESTTTVALDDAGTSASILSISGKFSESELVKMASRGMLAQQNATTPPAERSPASGLTYKTPEGWDAGPASAMRRASFVVSDGSQEASVAVTAFSTRAGPKIADPLANINRWRREVGLPPVTEDTLAEGTRSIEVDGKEGLYVALDGEGTLADKATRAVMVEHDDQVWFFKLSGPRELVQRETEPFRQFVESVSFGDE